MARSRSLVSVLAVLALALGGLAACGGDDDDDGAADDETTTTAEDSGEGHENTLEVEMQEYGYDVSGALAEGWTRFEFRNTGEEYHMAGLARLKQGVSLSDVTEMLQQLGGEGEGGGSEDDSSEESLGEIQLVAAQESTTTSEGDGASTSSTEAPTTSEPTTDTSTDDAPVSSDDTTGTSETTDTTAGDEGSGEEEGGDPFAELFEGEVGAPSHALAPGRSVAFTTEALDPGTYAMICFLPTPEGVPHFAEGMVASFEVEESDEPAGEEPEADTTLTIGDGSVELGDGEDELPAGTTTVEYVNDGDGPHELVAVEKLDEDATFDEIDEHFDAFDEGAPPTADNLEDGPAILDVYAFDVPAGERYFVELELTKGTWLLGCGREDEETGEKHGTDETLDVTVT